MNSKKEITIVKKKSRLNIPENARKLFNFVEFKTKLQLFIENAYSKNKIIS